MMTVLGAIAVLLLLGILVLRLRNFRTDMRLAAELLPQLKPPPGGWAGTAVLHRLQSASDHVLQDHNTGQAHIVSTVAIIRTIKRAQSIPAHRAVARTRAGHIFYAVDALLPRRLRHEEIGDALEFINAPNRTARAIYIKTVSAVVWVTINTLRELMSVAWGRATK